jgi:hypothetical protein
MVVIGLTGPIRLCRECEFRPRENIFSKYLYQMHLISYI